MLSIPNKLLKYLRAAQSKLAAIVSFVTDVLGDEQSTLADWQAGTLAGVAGVDFPATVLTAPAAPGDVTITVASTAGFTVGDAGDNVGYLGITDGVSQEVVSYTGSNNTQFTGLTRGLYGTMPLAWGIGDFVLQVEPIVGQPPEYNLTSAPKNFIQPNVGGAGPPVARTGATMVYSPATQLYYMFGGYDPVGAVYLQDLWTFDPATNNWALLAPIGGPPALRGFHVMIFHEINGELWVFGGQNGGGNLLDTWKYNIVANTWVTNVLWNHPFHVAGYTQASGVYVESGGVGLAYIFGGVAGAIHRTEAYAFNGIAIGTSWFAATPMPFGIAYGAAVYLEFIGKVLYVGVQADLTTQITYLWIPSTTTSYWDNTTPAPLPALRRSPAMVYDSVNHNAILYGGEDTPGVGEHDTYEYDSSANQWTQLATYQRDIITQGTGAYDPDNQEALYWGGAQNWAVPTMPAFPNPIRFRYFWQSSKYYTDVIDLGEMPTEPGEWILEDITDTTNRLNYIDYEGEWSATGIAPWTNIGSIKDGDEITVLARYWRVYVDMQNDGISSAAQVTLVDASYSKYIHFSMASMPIDNYPPLIKNVSTLSSKVDIQTCKGTIGTMRVELIRSGLITDQILKTAWPKRKDVRVKLGVLEDDIAVPDFHTVLRARNDDWSASITQNVFELADYIDEIKQDIPQEDIAGIVVPLDYSVGGIATHPVDIILDMLQNQINIPDRDLDLDSFTVVRNHPSLSGWQFRQDICCPEDASKFLQDLCKHIGAAIVPRESGKLSLILFNADDDTVMTWNELDQAFKGEKFMGKASSIRNYISVWWNWDTAGEGVANYKGIEVATDNTSITRHGNKVLRIKSHWLGNDLPPPNPPYAGNVIALTIADRILDMSKVGLQEISMSTNMSAFEAQVGDLIRIQTSTLRDNREYKEWQRMNDGERDKLILWELNGCETIVGWTPLWDAANPVLNTNEFIYGNASVDLGKVGVGPAQSGVTFTVAYDMSFYDYHVMSLFIANVTLLKTAGNAVHVEFQTAAGNYFSIDYEQADLVAGVNHLGDHKDNFDVTGAPDWANITRLRLYYWTDNALDAIPIGDMWMDSWRSFKWQTPANETGRYSFPYINYGTNECVDLKWWIKSKSVDFAKGVINWGLTRARQVPLDKEYDDQADWYEGQGTNIDLQTTPGSVLIAIEAGPNYYDSAYAEMIMDLGQQPEQDGIWTLEDTIPIGTGVVYQAWSSETGAFEGEENYLGFIVDQDAVSIKSRYYKGRATLFSNTANTVTPSVDRVLLRFALG